MKKISPSTEACRRRLERRKAERFKQVRHNPQDIPPVVVYNNLQAIGINLNIRPTTETCLQANKLFEEKIKQASIFKSPKIEDKKDYWRHLFHTAKQAMYHNGCIRYSRNCAHPEYSKIRIQVIESAVENKLFLEHRSPKGSPKESRLLPMPELYEYAETDPWTFAPNIQKQFVYLRNRKTKEDMISLQEIKALPSWHIARETQERLELINQVNSRYEIIYDKYDEYERDFVGRCQIRPIHFAIFTDRWDWHGRLYTGHYGHQSLRKIERNYLEFNRCPCVELDYGGMHTRLLYHIHRINYQDDPYALWGDKTTKARRRLAKTLMNIALNSKNRESAIAECNNQMCSWTRGKDKHGKTLRKRKCGDSLSKAIQLYDDYKKEGLTFGQIYDLAIKIHKPIARYFGGDAGIWLMRCDSMIAIDILYEFAKQAIPCLSCHDSFIVPEHHEQQLREYMNRFYKLRFRFFPVIK